MGKKIALWYVHKSVDLKLRIAEKITNIVFSATPESFRLKSKKLHVVGHGIDINKYNFIKNTEKEIDIVCVGRISPIKNQKLLIEAIDILVNELGKNKLKVVLVGEKEGSYYKELEKTVEEKKLKENVIFAGGVSNNQVIDYYKRAKLSVNLCPTGGMDKVVLESMASGTHTIVFNKTFKNILLDEMIIKEEDPQELADKIIRILKLSEDEKDNILEGLRNIVVNDHNLEKLIQKIISIYNNSV